MSKSILRLSVILMCLPNATLAAPTLAVPEIFQEQTNWCWAACPHCVIEYYGTEVIQCEIVNYTFGYTSCCTNPSGCNSPNCICGNGCCDYAVEGWGITTDCVNDSLSISEIEAELELYQPFIIFRARTGTGHVIVGHGFQGNDVLAMDPWMTEGYVIIDYDYLLSGGSMWWDMTILMAEQPVCNCSEVSACCDGCRQWPDGNSCQADDPCQLPDGECLAGECVGTPVEDGTLCDDADLCTQLDSCRAGQCVGDDPVTCTPLSQCHLAGDCDPATGQCSDPLADDGTECDDGDSCTQLDACQAGSCAGADPVVCTPLSQCHLAGECDSATGQCSNPIREDGTVCDDSDRCTQSDTCQAGACTGADPVECTAASQCHLAGTCDPATGLCSQPLQEDGTVCDDANLCTQSDTCRTGTCVGAEPVECVAANQCHLAGVCDPFTGQCSDPVRENGSQCDDGDICTRLDACRDGNCLGSAPVVCEPPDSCHLPGTCDPQTGECSNPAKDDGAECDDGNICTKHDSCQAGVCAAGEPVECDDGDPCTDNECDPQKGCVFIETDCPSTAGCGCAAPGDRWSAAGSLVMVCLGLLLAWSRRRKISARS